MIAVTGTVMTTDIPAATDEDKAVKIRTDDLCNINRQCVHTTSTYRAIWTGINTDWWVYKKTCTHYQV